MSKQIIDMTPVKRVIECLDQLDQPLTVQQSVHVLEAAKHILLSKEVELSDSSLIRALSGLVESFS